jgi:hypothetical protein
MSEDEKEDKKFEFNFIDGVELNYTLDTIDSFWDILVINKKNGNIGFSYQYAFTNFEHFEHWVSCVREAHADAMKRFEEEDENERR